MLNVKVVGGNKNVTLLFLFENGILACLYTNKGNLDTQVYEF